MEEKEQRQNNYKKSITTVPCITHTLLEELRNFDPVRPQKVIHKLIDVANSYIVYLTSTLTKVIRDLTPNQGIN